MKAAHGPFRRLHDRFRARRDGRRDGLLGIPAPDETAYPPALLQIAHRGNEELAELARGWVTADADLAERTGASTRGLASAEEDVEIASEVVAGAKQRAGSLADASVARSSTDGPHISKKVYVVAIVAILAAEFPLNAIAFRLFGEAEVLTWVMTASLAVTLVLCAHGLGTFLRLEHPTIAERRWVIVLVVLPVLTLIAIALIRARYLSLESRVTGLDALGPVVGSLVFLVINLLIYTGATMLSYLAHGPRPDRTARDARGELGSARSGLRQANRNVRRYQEELEAAGVRTEAARRVARARADELIAYHHGLMAVYCAANLRARQLPNVPPVLRELPPLELPSAIASTATTALALPSPNGKVAEVRS